MLKAGVPANMYRQALAVLTYTSNWQYQGRDPTYWGNTWSLSVEEQFYIAWSILLPLLLSLPSRLRQTVILLLIATSMSLSYINITASFHLPHYLVGWDTATNNVWKMLVGAYFRLNPSLSLALTKKRFAWIGLVILFMTMAFLSATTTEELRDLGLGGRYVGWNVFIEPMATLCSVIIVLGSIKGNWLLETRILRFLGRISYSLYLYSGALLLIQDWPRGWQGIQITCTAACLAIFSTFMLEEPFRSYYRSLLAANR